jgi:hypothetical protein
MRSINIAVVHSNGVNVLANLIHTTDDVPIPRKDQMVAFKKDGRSVRARVTDVMYEYTAQTTFVNLFTDWLT